MQGGSAVMECGVVYRLEAGAGEPDWSRFKEGNGEGEGAGWEPLPLRLKPSLKPINPTWIFMSHESFHPSL